MVDMVGLLMIDTVSDKANSFKLDTGVPTVGNDVSNPDAPTLIKWLDIPDPMTSNDDIPTLGFIFIYSSLTSAMLGVNHRVELD